MEAHSLGVGDSFDEAVEKLTRIALTTLIRVFALALQDGHELGSGLEESAPFADVSKAQSRRAGCAVTVGEQSAVVVDGGAPRILPEDRRGRRARIWASTASVTLKYASATVSSEMRA